jgi:hypothetical protein
MILIIFEEQRRKIVSIRTIFPAKICQINNLISQRRIIAVAISFYRAESCTYLTFKCPSAGGAGHTKIYIINIDKRCGNLKLCGRRIDFRRLCRWVDYCKIEAVKYAHAAPSPVAQSSSVVVGSSWPITSAWSGPISGQFTSRSARRRAR